MIQIRLVAFSIAILWAPICQGQSSPKGSRLRELIGPGFNIGGAMTVDDARGGDARFATYRDLAEREFSSIILASSMSNGVWKVPHSAIDPSAFVEAATWAHDKGLLVHGCTLVDPSANLNCVWFKELPQGDIESTLHQYVSSLAGATAGKVLVWDVVSNVIGDQGDPVDSDGVKTGERRAGTSSPYKEYSAMGQNYIANAFRWAHEADTKAKLIITESRAEQINAKSDRLLAFCKKLKSDGVPIDGVGFQHRWQDTSVTPDYDSIRANMQRFADAGFAIFMTDVEVSATRSNDSATGKPTNEQLARQRTIYKSLLALALEQPACKAFELGTFVEGQSLVNDTKRSLHSGAASQGTPRFNTIFLSDDSSGKKEIVPNRAYYGLQETLAANTKGLYRITSGWETQSSYLARLSVSNGAGGWDPMSTPMLHPLNDESASWESIKWYLERTGPNVYRIRCQWHGENGYLMRMADKVNDEWQANANIGMEGVHYGYPSQLWTLVPQPNGGYLIVNVWHPEDGALTRESNGKDANGQYVPGVHVRLYPQSDWSSQSWYFTRAD